MNFKKSDADKIDGWSDDHYYDPTMDRRFYEDDDLTEDDIMDFIREDR